MRQVAVCWVSPAMGAAHAVPMSLMPSGSWWEALTRARICSGISALGTPHIPHCRRSHGGTYLLLQLLFSGFILPVCEGRALLRTHPSCKVAGVVEEHVCIFCLKLEQPMLSLFPEEVFVCAGVGVLNFRLPLFEPASFFI